MLNIEAIIDAHNSLLAVAENFVHEAHVSGRYTATRVEPSFETVTVGYTNEDDDAFSMAVPRAEFEARLAKEMNLR